MNKQQLLVELQSAGLKLASAESRAVRRMDGADPCDHKAVIDDPRVMVPIFNPAANSPSSHVSQGSQLSSPEIDSYC